MNTHIYRSNKEPKRLGLTFEEKWRRSDKGLITCWEVGQVKRATNPDLAEKAQNGELPVLGWQGGVERALIKNEKYGTLNYLAQWQGLRGDDLDIDVEVDRELTCTRTGMKVIFTADSSKYSA